MSETYIQKIELEISPGTARLCAYLGSNDSPSDSKTFCATKAHFKFQPKLNFGDNQECREYLSKQAIKHANKFKDFKDIPDEEILK